jgi:hypothetical protein
MRRTVADVMMEAAVHVEPTAPLTRVLQLMVGLKSHKPTIVASLHARCRTSSATSRKSGSSATKRSSESSHEPKHCGNGNQQEGDGEIEAADDVNRFDEVHPKNEVAIEHFVQISAIAIGVDPRRGGPFVPHSTMHRTCRKPHSRF